jgi:hypothetical protein
MERGPAQFATSSQVTDSQFDFCAVGSAEAFTPTAREDLVAIDSFLCESYRQLHVVLKCTPLRTQRMNVDTLSPVGLL